MRITVACPESLIAEANQLAMALAFSEADAQTYGEARWQDAQGNAYACASFIARPEWIVAAQTTLQRPEWDTSQIIGMDKATQAQAALLFWSGQGPIPKANTTQLVAIAGMEGLAAINAMGLTWVAPEDEL